MTPNRTEEMAITLKISGVNQVVVVEANDSDSAAARLAPMDALLDEHSARTEVKPFFIENFTSPMADFGEPVEMAPGTFSINSNGIGLGQDTTYFRGFPDGDYDIDFDGVPFYDTNTPTTTPGPSFLRRGSEGSISIAARDRLRRSVLLPSAVPFTCFRRI